jgi:hypothetical protein
LNSFHNRLRRLRKADLRVENLNRLCNYIKESCQTHSGITAETLYRDESWYFHQIGRAIERADQTTRLVDVKYQVLLPQPSDVGSPIDEAQWNTLLRSAAGFHAFRRNYPQSMCSTGASRGRSRRACSSPTSICTSCDSSTGTRPGDPRRTCCAVSPPRWPRRARTT